MAAQWVEVTTYKLLWVICCRYLPGVSESASAHLERLEGSRRLFTAAGALGVAQRQLLYAHDELAMALLRIETRMEGEQVGGLAVVQQDGVASGPNAAMAGRLCVGGLCRLIKCSYKCCCQHDSSTHLSMPIPAASASVRVL